MRFTAVAIQAHVAAVRTRTEYPQQIAYLSALVRSAVHAASMEAPVRLVVLPEASFQGFHDEHQGQDHVEYASELAVDLPGPETRALGRIARLHSTYLVASAKARHDAFPDRYFNVAFILSPDGEIVHKHYKCQTWAQERSLTPGDVMEMWTTLYGDGLDAFFPVARLPIGNVATTLCVEGSFPELYRGLALNGAELITRATYPEPWVSDGVFEVQNRARALDNTCYVVAPNHTSQLRKSDGTFLPGVGNGGRSMIVDYRGKIVSELQHASEGFAAALIDMDALRAHRMQARFCNFLPYLRTELYQRIYSAPLWSASEGPGGAEVGPKSDADAQFDAARRRLVERGAFRPS